MEKEGQIRVHEEVKEEVAKVSAKMEKDQEKIRVHEEMEKEAKASAKMEKEEWEEEVEEAALLVRKSKPSKSTAINGSANAPATDDVNSNGKVDNNESNGGVHESMVSVTENGGADESSVVGEEKPQGLVEPPPTTTTTLTNGDTDKTHEANENGQQRSENCVYHDKDEGGNFISFFPGEEPTDKDPALEGLNVTSQSISVEKSPTSANNYQYQKHFKDESLPTSTLWPSEFSHDDHNASHKSSSTKEIESADVDLIDESDLDVAGIDVEKVLQKQNTHDLFCPNCNSCITRRVILRKRKRRVRTPTEDVKRNKPEARVEDKVAASTLQAISDQGHDTSNVHDVSSSIPAANDNDLEREPDIFRCLSCFSFFIPTGNGFKLFRTFGRKGEKPTTQDEQISDTNRNWFPSIFASHKGKKPAEQGSANKADREEDEQGALTLSLSVSNENGQSSSTKEIVSTAPISEGLPANGTAKRREPAVNGNMTITLGDKSHDTMQFDQGGAVMDAFKVDNGKQFKQSSSFKQYLPNQGSDEAVPVPAGRAPVTNGEYAADAVSATRQDGLKLLISSDMGTPLLDKSQTNQILDMDIQKKTPDDESMNNISVSNGKVHISVDIPQQYELDAKTMLVTDRVLEDKITTFKVSHKDGIYGNQNSNNTITKAEVIIQAGETLKTNKEAAAKIASGKDTVILVESGPTVAEASQGVESAIVSAEAGASLLGAQASAELNRTEAGENYKIEIIKSIVYGGLVESITSLSVVSSATGGGAATLNTVALGLANLIGGIFFVVHNLWQLKNDQEDQAINQVTERADRYQELLGRRKNFVLHAVVAMLSYIIFGLLPPIIYGFSFRTSNDRELKLLVVAAASFLCILVLATAKAYVQRPPKSYLGTIFLYIVMGFMVSGVSYVAGELVNRLLEKLGLFEPSSVPTLSPPDMTPNNRAWAFF